MPLAALPADSHTALVVEADERDPTAKDGLAALPVAAAPDNPSASTPNSPPVAANPAAETAPTAPAATEPPAAAAAPSPNASPAPGPLFRSRQLPEKGNATAIPAVIPLTRAPDDPGVDEDLELDEYGEPNQPRTTQAGGWRGFLSRLGG
jgi:HemY protein